MEFQQLEMFAAVVEEQSVTRAAERVCRTAPAVTMALRKLEEEMGAPLFDRSERHNHRLTEAGKVLYSHASRILEMRKAATESVKELIPGGHGTLRLGTHESVSLYFLPSLLRAFDEEHAGVKTEIVCGTSKHLLADLDKRTIELALIADAPDISDLERHEIMQDELVIITNPKHKLVGARQICVRDLAGELLLVQGTKSLLRERIIQALKATGTPFSLGVENVAIESIKRMVAAGAGIGFVPMMCVREEVNAKEVVALKVQDVPSKWILSLVWRKEHSLSLAARRFIAVTLHAIESAEPNMDQLGKHKGKSTARVKNGAAFPLQSRKVIHC